MYKVGDLVVIKERVGKIYDYPCSYVNSMTQYEGRVAKITQVHNVVNKASFKACKYYNGDDNYYYLDITGTNYSWSSPMLRSYIVNPKFINLDMFII